MSSGDKKKTKQDKRANALRDNLRRRKEQAKVRDTKDGSTEGKK